MNIEMLLMIGWMAIPISIGLSIIIATICYNLNYLIKTIKNKQDARER